MADMGGEIYCGLWLLELYPWVKIDRHGRDDENDTIDVLTTFHTLLYMYQEVWHNVGWFEVYHRVGPPSIHV